MIPQVLDVTCGGRMCWVQKTYPKALYMDIRVRDQGFMDIRPNFCVLPDVQADYKNIPFKDDTFNLVLYDPPHIIRKSANETGFMAMRYGKLTKATWKENISQGFMECWRVLKPGGTLIFKWSEGDKLGTELLDLFPSVPLFATRVGKTKKTIWYCFYRPDALDLPAT